MTDKQRTLWEDNDHDIAKIQAITQIMFGLTETNAIFNADERKFQNETLTEYISELCERVLKNSNKLFYDLVGGAKC